MRTIKAISVCVLLLVSAASGAKAQGIAPAPMRAPGEPPEVFVAAQGPVPSAAPAPPHRPDLGKWWKNSEIARELGLSEQQISQIEQSFFDHRLKLIDLHADVQRQEARLQPLMEADQVDEAKVSAQIDLLLAARSKLEKANVMMMLSIRRVLSVEQWKKLEAIKQERERAWGPMAPGEPMGPPPGGQPVPARPPRPPRPPQEP